MEKVQVQPFALSIDGTNGTGVEKMNHLTVRIYNASSKQVYIYCLDMCISTGQGAGTAESIFQKNETLILHNISWTKVCCHWAGQYKHKPGQKKLY